jgi:hypothetical protein
MPFFKENPVTDQPPANQSIQVYGIPVLCRIVKFLCHAFKQRIYIIIDYRADTAQKI